MIPLLEDSILQISTYSIVRIIGWTVPGLSLVETVWEKLIKKRFNWNVMYVWL